jgi:hypothetical protein
VLALDTSSLYGIKSVVFGAAAASAAAAVTLKKERRA